MRYGWLVAEATPYWSRFVRRFGPAALPSDGDSLAVTCGTAPQIRALCQRAATAGDAAVVLWVLQRDRVAEVIAALSTTAAAPAKRNTLHLAALDPTLTLRGTAGRHARLALQEWQITAVLDAPEQLAMLLPLVRRHLVAIRPKHPPLDALLDLAPPPTGQ